MDQGYSMLGFVVIVILYAVIGLMAAAGTISITRKLLAPKAEQIFYAMFLIMVAAFYLAFAAYFGVATAWRVETAVVWRLSYRPVGRAPALRPDRRIFPARAVGLAARTSGAWSLLRVRAGPVDRDPARLRILLCSLRLFHGGVFLYATRRLERRMEGGATVRMAVGSTVRPPL